MKLPFFLAKRFVAGETFEDSVPIARQLNQKNLKLTLDLLGEYVKSKVKATQTVEDYIKLLDGIAEYKLDSSISIKLTMMGLKIDRDFCRDNLFRLMDAAKKHQQFVRIDMEGSDVTQDTLDIFKEALAVYGSHIGIVLQCALHRTLNDVKELTELGADIRLVKGAYKEPPDIALQDLPAIRESFKECSRILLANSTYPRFATHDDQLVEWVKKYADENNIPKERYEFQMLYGLREETMVSLAKEGYNARIYVPYGTDWFPYYRRRLMERKENVLFILNTMFKK